MINYQQPITAITATAREPCPHQLGDGLHSLPVLRIMAGRAAPESSRPCIMLLFVIWAQRNGFDPVAIYERARPDAPMLRPDQLRIFLQWTQVPGEIDTTLLMHDLAAIDEQQLCQVIREIESGGYRPEKAYTHWVVTSDGRIAGEARELDPPNEPDEQGQHFCYVRLFAMPEMAEYGYTDASNLRPKHEFTRSTHGAG